VSQDPNLLNVMDAVSRVGVMWPLGANRARDLREVLGKRGEHRIDRISTSVPSRFVGVFHELRD